MPPGNNNAKPIPKKCTYCRKESCRGDSCTSSGYEGVCGKSSDRTVRYAVNQGPDGRSTYVTRQVSGVGNVSTSTNIPHVESTCQQNIGGVTTRATTAVHHVEPYISTTNTIWTESKMKQKNTIDNKTEINTALQSGPFPHKVYVSQPGQQVGTYGSHSSLQSPGIMRNEQVTPRTASGAVQLTSSTITVNSKPSIMPDVKMDKTACLPMPLIPVTQLKLVEDKVSAMKDSIPTSTICEADLQNVELNKTNVKKPKTHSRNALKYEGVVVQIYGSRNAKVRVAERNGVPLPKSEWGTDDVVYKFALLIVDKIMQDDQETFYPHTIRIDSVLSKGDIIILICTAHNNPSSEFQLFAHQAWRTGNKIQIINDTDSVASYCSQTGSETQESTSTKTKKSRFHRKKDEEKEVLNVDTYDVSDVVNHWLDTNECSQNRNENSKALKLLAGCHYIGKVIEVRLPYVFIVEVSSNDGKQMVFVFSSKFHPQGISSPAMAPGVSLESSVNIGDEIIVIPVKNTSMQENKFEWVANKAWPKNIQSTISSNLHCSNSSEQLIGPLEILNQQGDTVLKTEQPTYLKNHSPSAKNLKEFDGVILSLQYDWGLVKESVGSQSAYVFTRENAYLFGLCLEHFFLNDVLKEGQLVKFSLETAEIGAMTALAVWCGNKLPDFNSFDISASKYCEERGVKFTIEDLLIQHGKLMYLGQ